MLTPVVRNFVVDCRDKQWLEDARGGRHFEEVLLVTEDGGVLEGTQTNFFAIYVRSAMQQNGWPSRSASSFLLQDGKLWTANDGVLDGTVRGVVLRAAKELNIPVSSELHSTPLGMTWCARSPAALDACHRWS